MLNKLFIYYFNRDLNKINLNLVLIYLYTHVRNLCIAKLWQTYARERNTKRNANL